MKKLQIIAAACTLALFSSCSALFENIYDDSPWKNSDVTLTAGGSTNTDIYSGLVMIKASRPTINQITYNNNQTTYYVGEVPDGYSDSTFDGTASYTNGSRERILAKDNPVEFRCFVNDSNASVSWSARQTWQYTEVFSTDAEALASPVNVPLYQVSGVTNNSRMRTILPYGVTEVTCTITADDGEHSSTYTIIVTKSYQSNYSTNTDDNTITDSGLVAISAAEPEINQITYSPNIYEYTITDITSADNDMTFRFIPATSNTQVEWNIRQTQTFTPTTTQTEETVFDSELDANTTIITTTVTGQTASACNNVIDFTFDETFTGNQAIYATIPYGVTEVKATVTPSGELPVDYTITLTRNITGDSSSSSTVIGNYSKLSELTVDVTAGSNSSTGTLTPAFDPNTTTYTLTVDEEADSITIGATPADEGAVISNPVSITKYGRVPNISGNTVPLVGGTSKITFTVTDETEVSRTYTIYVVKPTDGDTKLSSLTYTPEESFANGVKGFTFDDAFAGKSEAEITAATGAAKYGITLSADSRVDVTSMTFTAVPNNRRTTVAYGVSSSISTLPETWTENYSYATQTGSSPASHTVEIGDEDTETVKRILWVKTISDEFFHVSNGVYETEKRADIRYHTVELSKAGDANQNLTALVVVATYEDGSTKTVLTQTTSEEVAYATEGVRVSKDITTYADKLDFYFRPLDKDAAVTYSAKNTAYAGSSENTSFTGYSADATSEGIEQTSSCSELNDGANQYYHFSIGEIFKGTGVNSDNSNTSDLPNGTTEVTICGVTYNFVKPDRTDTSYSVSGWSGTGTGGIDSGSRTSYIYIKNEVQSIVLSLNVTQQNATVSIASIEQTADANSNTVASPSTASYAVLHEDTADNAVSNKWKVSIGNATYSADGYTRTAPENIPEENTIIPIGTTRVVLNVNNNGTTKAYTYFIVRADDSEARLKTLTLTNPVEPAAGTTVSANIAPQDFDWTSTENGAYLLSATAYNLDKGRITLNAKAVSENATITVTRRHNAWPVSVGNVESTEWSDEVTITNSSTRGNSEFTGNYDITENDAGTLLFTVTVTAGNNTNTHVYKILAKVEADPTVKLNALEIVQNGSRNGSTGDYTNSILANSFAPTTYNYNNLSASLSYTGDIVVTPTKYPRAIITGYDVKVDDDSILGTSGVTATSAGVITVPYDYYIDNLGKSLVFSYTVQAQDRTVTPVTYTATVAIPELTTVTEVTRQTISTEYTYEVPTTTNSSRLAYRFGSVIADESSFLGPKPEENKPGYFGGIDITGTNDSSTWYESSFGQSGFQLVMNVADSSSASGTDYWVALDENGRAAKFFTVDFTGRTVTELSPDEVTELGIGLTVEPEFKYEGETPYLALRFNVTNSNEKFIKLGASIDTLVGTIAQSTAAANDRVRVEETDNGFIMKGSDYTFTVCLKNAFGVDDVDRIWYGAYDTTNFSYLRVFENNSSNSSLPDGTDSAASFSWDLGSESSYTKTIRISMSAASGTASSTN